MSRGTDDWGEGTIPWGLWEKSTRLALHGKRGQKALRELEAALLALPAQELAYEQIAEGERVCAIGAYALAKGRSLEDLRDYYGRYNSVPTLDETADFGTELGLRRLFAWAVAEANDKDEGAETPHERWVRMLAWIRACMHAEVSA